MILINNFELNMTAAVKGVNNTMTVGGVQGRQTVKTTELGFTNLKS